ncbi:AAA family ATPase [Planococcus sp. N028]|uniref:AAA family ATPase n=1 Tax=Planococcus shixiaomingii TaxID=3058393 RepID=A0ABT8MZ15_9BACL|nr:MULTISPECIES: AAA family ATPase [unclassified Planococcus (in: firmicutes)]MDN7240713.1 AAA family ATPase [Planococcus sp. N028]WKA56617.1 AAA family ATPase [Planococcus sp. N022]
MEKFVFIFGPQAVGKMTVGQELASITGLKLFHNHMTIDLLEPLFGFSPEMWHLTTTFRREIFRTFSTSEQYGMIFTKVWYFDKQEDWDEIESICEIFREQGVEIYFVELEADVEERLFRNKTPHRLENKPTKRNVVQSEQNLLDSVENRRLNSLEGEISVKNYLRIDNTNMDALEAALIIKKEFVL